MDWFVASLGNARGEVRVGGHRYRLDGPPSHRFPRAVRGEAMRSLPRVGMAGTPVRLRSERGKLGDSHDTMLFLGTRVDPSTTDFVLEATFEVTSSRDAGRQAGYGLVALDALAAGADEARHRNMLAAGCFRMRRFDAYEFGARVVAGHSSPDARENGAGRLLDPTRTFSSLPEAALPVERDPHAFRLEKTADGFICSVDGGGEGASALVRGHDFLTVQDPSSLYVGVFVSGRMEVAVSDLHLQTTSGRLCHTPDGEIRLVLPDYPFSRELVAEPSVSHHGTSGLDVIYASPDGTPGGMGSLESPLDIQTALLAANGRSRVVLRDGTYHPGESIVLPRGGGNRGTRVVAEHEGMAVLDGASLGERVPVMTILGNGWHVLGLVFQNGPSCGLLICGSDNVIERCVARRNADTGILICAFPGDGRDLWPSGNLVGDCEAHDNCDPVRSNADGFGAKLRVGEGNRFYRCTSHHNIDDGFDLYAKGVLGPTGAVVLERCVAYANGHLSGEEPRRGGDCGSGFKLGGEGLPVPHLAEGCSAYENDHAGFFSNSNPACVLRDVTAWGNGSGSDDRDIVLTTGPGKNGDGTAPMCQRAPRLLFVVPRLSGGGAERVIASLASMMAERYEVVLVTTVRGDGAPEYGTSGAVRVVNLYDWAVGRPHRDGDGGLVGKARRSADVVGAMWRNASCLASAATRLVRRLASSGRPPSRRGVALLVEAEWLRRLKREMEVGVSVSFLNSANWLNVASRGRERCVVSVRSFIDGEFAPSDCRDEGGASQDRRGLPRCGRGRCRVTGAGGRPAVRLRHSRGACPNHRELG